MNSYELIFDYRQNKHYNNELLNLIKRNNKSCFEDWMTKGHWEENYVPLSLINEKNDIITTLGVIKTNLYINQRKCNAIQLSRIIVKEGYEDQGVEQQLLKAIVNKYSNVSDIIYSFAEDEEQQLLLENNFTKVQEYVYFIPWNPQTEQEGTVIKKIDTDSVKDLEFLQEEIKHSTRISPAISTNGDSGVKMYNILKHYRRNVYFVPSMDATVVFTINNNVFTLVAVFSKSPIDVMDLLSILVPVGIERVEFGFIPKCENLHIRELNLVETPEGVIDSRLFINEITTRIAGARILFPLLSREK
ncbi:hypothetical protein [[Acholeplasma] multilocale]|uniref:hypothetical protein n=1 Tax=[Acholeplasma] multilocale TaxID=264638 RepID=UPI00047D83E6|nr:hypothetical protein [[Acholeplasma] multilocale]